MAHLSTVRYSSLLLFGLAGSASAQSVQWMRQGGIGGQGQAIGYDAAQNVYVAGIVNAPALFDATTTASHFADAFLAKYDPTGVVQWVRTGGGELIDQVNDIAVDATGNAYVTGSISTSELDPTVAFDGTLVTGLGSTDLFLAKYDANGNLLWFRRAGGAQGDQGRGVALTPDGDVVVSGFFQGEAVFGDDTLTSAGMSDVVLLKYDADGNQLWSTQAGGPGEDQAGKLAALTNGDMAVVGQFQQTANFGATALTSIGLGNIFLARFDNAGDALWAVRAGSATNFASDVAFDIDDAPNGDLVLCGEIAGAADFGALSVPTNGNLDVFLARYAGDGTPVWAHHGGGPQQDHAYGVELDAEGNSYLTGQADDGASTVFDTITLAPFGNEAVFLAKYDATGAVQWVKRYAPGLGRALAVLATDCLYFTGGASGIVGQPAFDDVPWQYVDRAIFTASFCTDEVMSAADASTAQATIVFPNPASDVLNVLLQERPSARMEVVLVDALGRAVRSFNSPARQLQVDVSDLENGSYQLVLRENEARRTMPVLVQH